MITFGFFCKRLYFDSLVKQCCHMDSVVCWTVLSDGQCCLLNSVVRWTVLSDGQCCQIDSVFKWTVLSDGQCCQVDSSVCDFWTCLFYKVALKISLSY